MAAVVVLNVLLILYSIIGPVPGKFVVGPSLPPGKIAPQLVSASGTAVLLAPDGSLWYWGNDQFRPGPYGASTANTLPKRFGSDSDWRNLAHNDLFTLALKSDGTLWGWGWDSSGELAQPRPTNYFAQPTRIGTDSDWAQISAGAGHALALKSDGSLWAWGQNDHGQIGDGTSTNHFTITRIGADNDWRTIAAGAFNSYALKSDGTVWGWGFAPIRGGTLGTLSPLQIDPGTNWVSLSASTYTLLALKSDGTLWIIGENAMISAPQYVSGSTASFVQIGADKDWQSVFAGAGFFFARKRDGSWWVSGMNERLQLGGIPKLRVTNLRRVGFDFEPWAFAAGAGNCVLLTKDGTLWTWGARLGTARTDLSKQFGELLDNLRARSQNLQLRTRMPEPITDHAPYKLWELPAAIRNSLSTNAPSENQPATNAAAKAPQ